MPAGTKTWLEPAGRRREGCVPPSQERPHGEPSRARAGGSRPTLTCRHPDTPRFGDRRRQSRVSSRDAESEALGD